MNSPLQLNFNLCYKTYILTYDIQVKSSTILDWQTTANHFNFAYSDFLTLSNLKRHDKKF